MIQFTDIIPSPEERAAERAKRELARFERASVKTKEPETDPAPPAERLKAARRERNARYYAARKARMGL